MQNTVYLARAFLVKEKEKREPTSTKEDMVNYSSAVSFPFFQEVRKRGVRVETHLDCYGSLTDTSVAEDGYLKEHSYGGTLFNMKTSASVSLLWFGCGGNTERMRERERTRLTILDYGEKNGQNWMTVKKQVNACKLEYRTVNRLVVLKERNATSGGSCPLHVVADLHHTTSARNPITRPVRSPCRP